MLTKKQIKYLREMIELDREHVALMLREGDMEPADAIFLEELEAELHLMEENCDA